jgi:hypothetical protein
MNAKGAFRAVLFLGSALAAPLSAQSVWTVPGIVNTPGQNGTHFVSDLTLSNPGTTPASAGVSFLSTTGRIDREVALLAGESRVFRNVVDGLFATTGAGILSISSDQPLLLRARTYNAAPSGTYGVALPVVASDRLLTPGEVGDSLWISQDPSPSAGYRTNVAVVFPDDAGGAATVTVYDADGNARGSKDFSLDSPGLQQFSVSSFAGAVPAGRAQIAVTRGHAAGYSAVVDNVTGDSSLFTFEDLPGGIQDVLINGVARANGKNGTFFRTDGRFFNPTDTDATVRVSFHASGNANSSPASASFVVPAGKIRDVVDVLATLLGLPVGSAGALRFQSTWPVAILCRTSNVDPTGANPGTYGAQQKPVPLLSLLSSADAGALITGVRQNAAFRTNVALAAGADGATAQLTLKTAGGATAGSASQTLGPYGWVQTAVDKLFGTIPDDAQILVKITQGSADAFDSSVDNASGDSVVTPAQALPIAIPSSATVGPAGGSIRSDDGRLTLKVPAGALAAPISLSFQTATNDAPQGVGPGYQILPASVAFSKPALLTLAYGRVETDDASAEALTLGATSGSGWYAIGGGSIDPGRHTLTVPLDSTSPASVAPGSQPLLAPGPNFFAVIRSWQFVPAGNRTIFTGERVRFTVYFVGYSSGMANQGRVFLPSSPSEVEVSWFINGAAPGVHPEEGTIVAEGNSGVYIAPQCRPPRNPLVIHATIASKGLLSFPYRPRGQARLRVLTREWIASARYVIDQQCQGSEDFLDHLVFTGDLAFTLDDKLKVTGGSFLPGTKELGTESACSGCGCSDVKRTSVPDFSFSLVSGTYNPDDDLFDITFFVSLPVRPGYSYMWGDPKRPGDSPPESIANVLNPVLVPGVKHLVYKASYLLSLTMQIKQNKPGCP